VSNIISIPSINLNFQFLSNQIYLENKDEVKETVEDDKNKFGQEVTIKIGRKDYKCRNISIDQINIQIKNKNVDENCSYGNSKGNICCLFIFPKIS